MCIHLLHDPGTVGLDGLIADAQVLGDRPAGLAAADEPEDLALPLGEILAHALIGIPRLAAGGSHWRRFIGMGEGHNNNVSVAGFDRIGSCFKNCSMG